MSEQDEEAQTGEDQQEPKVYRTKRGRLLHEVLAETLIDQRHARMIDGVPAVWDGIENRYVVGYDAWSVAIIDTCGGTTRNERGEVSEYLRLVAPKEEQGNTHLIACSNGVVDPWREGFGTVDEEGHYRGFYANTPQLNITNVLPVEWSPGAYDATTDEALDDFANGDPIVRTNLEEVLAACIYRGREIQNMAVLVGRGGNGKSVFMGMLCGLLGRDNYAALDLRDLGKQFMTVQLFGKLANVGDDIADGLIDAAHLAIVKKLVTGDPITADMKHKTPITTRPYCKLVFSANEFPRLGDYTTGMLDRIHGVQFTADFRHSGRRVTDMAARLDTDESRSYLLNLALARLPELVSRGTFTKTPYSDAMRDSVLLDNDSVAYWIYSESITPARAEGVSVADFYERYSTFCKASGRMPVERKAFTTRVNRRLGLVTRKDLYTSGHQVRAFHVADK